MALDPEITPTNLALFTKESEFAGLSLFSVKSSLFILEGTKMLEPLEVCANAKLENLSELNIGSTIVTAVGIKLIRKIIVIIAFVSDNFTNRIARYELKFAAID